jgi:uncharacterized protein
MELRMLRHLALRSGLGMNYVAKEERISQLLCILRYLFGSDVVLKGGTGFNRVHLSQLGVARFSEDIDLDYVPEGDLDGRIKSISEKMLGIDEFQVEGPRLLHRTLRFDARYVNELGSKDRVCVEFYLTRKPHLSVEEVLVKSPFVDAHPTIFTTYSAEDLLARKMMALYNRSEGKDIYDVLHGLRLDLRRERLHEAVDVLVSFYRIEPGFYGSLAGKVGSLEERWKYIASSTNHFIPRSLRFDWKLAIRTLAEEIERIARDRSPKLRG